MQLSEAKQNSLQCWDGLRALLSAVKFPIRDSVVMLVLIEQFEASLAEKTAFAMALQAGFLISIPLVHYTRKFSLPLGGTIAGAHLLAAFFLLAASFSTGALGFIVFVCLAQNAVYAVQPLQTQVYAGYSSGYRGRRFSTSFILESLGSVGFALGAKFLLQGELTAFRLVLTFFAIAQLGAAYAASKYPHEKLKPNADSLKPFAAFSLLKTDKLFAYVLTAWFILGVANLWIAPYRANFLAEKQFGYAYKPATVVLLLSIIPEIVRLLAAPFLGKVFDQVNFIKLRIFLNCLFCVYYALFFFGDSFITHLISMILSGVAISGGQIAWNLWVTKMAPSDKISEYMGVHATLTGIRMVLAPLLGLYAMEKFGPQFCATVSIALIVLSILMLLPIVKFGQRRFGE